MYLKQIYHHISKIFSVPSNCLGLSFPFSFLIPSRTVNCIYNHFQPFRHSPFIHITTLVKLGLRKEKDALHPESILFPELKKGENYDEQL